MYTQHTRTRAHVYTGGERERERQRRRKHCTCSVLTVSSGSCLTFVRKRSRSTTERRMRADTGRACGPRCGDTRPNVVPLRHEFRVLFPPPPVATALVLTPPLSLSLFVRRSIYPVVLYDSSFPSVIGPLPSPPLRTTHPVSPA